MVALNVNGNLHHLEIDPDTPLLWVLRDHLRLTGTKYSCGIGTCGACTVHLNGDAVPSCSITAEQAEGFEITTIEGLSGPVARALFTAWEKEGVPQCGYCQPGQIMTAAALLGRTSHPTDAEIEEALSNVLCRCGTYQKIRTAIYDAMREVQGV